MRIIVKPAFDRDIDKVRSKSILTELDKKITQIEKAKNLQNITGIKLLRTYKTHYRIKVETGGLQYRIGAVVRSRTIGWFVFFPAKKFTNFFPEPLDSTFNFSQKKILLKKM